MIRKETSNTQAQTQANNAEFFEGSEKRLEIHFSCVAKPTLRSLPEANLEDALSLAGCSIVSCMSGDICDAYVLSESSLFVYDTCIVVKTCGVTSLLCALDAFIQLGSRLEMPLCSVKYSRASLLMPKRQPEPHISFDDEVSYLDGSLRPILGRGVAHVLGDRLASSLQWHVYYAGRPLLGSENGQWRELPNVTLEVCMRGMCEDVASLFCNENGDKSANEVAMECGLFHLFPNSNLNGFVFDPCGFSGNLVPQHNAKGGGANSVGTVHVTPERGCSYASVEIDNVSPNLVANSIDEILHSFRPSDACVSISGVEQMEPGKVHLPNMTRQSLPGNTFVIFSNDIGEKPMSVRNNVGCINKCAEQTFEADTSPTPPLRSSSPALSSNSKANSDSTERYDSDNDNANRNDQGVDDEFLGGKIRKGSGDLNSDIHCAVESSQEGTELICICNVGLVRRRIQKWRELLPMVRPHYAVKCNDDRVLLESLVSMGLKFDCASANEINLVLDCGASSADILFANPNKPIGDIKRANERNVHIATFDTLDELAKVKESNGVCADGTNGMALLMRIRADDTHARCPLGDKYGAEPKEWPELLDKANELNVQVRGIAFHVGSGACDPSAFKHALYASRRAFDIAEDKGMRFDILDIGGGMSGGGGSNPADGVSTGSSNAGGSPAEENWSDSSSPENLEEGATLEKVAPVINEGIDELFPPEIGVTIIAEPGRYIAEAAFTVVAKVIGRRIRPLHSVSHAYWIRDGVYGTFNSTVYDHATVTCESLEEGKAGSKKSTIFGPTCDGFDTILEAVDLPELNIGDWLVFKNMGAYTLSASSPFNGFDPKADMAMDYLTD